MHSKSWLSRYLTRSADAGETTPSRGWPALRQLERRRVLAADITGVSIEPDPVYEGETVTVAATATGIGPLEFDWIITRDSNPIADGFASSVDFTALDEGVYDVHLTVTDQADQISDSLNFQVTVLSAAPIVSVPFNQQQLEGSPIELNGSGQRPYLATFIDPGAPNTHTAAVDWGDGTVEQATIVELDGFYAVAGDHIYADNGQYTVTVTVTDDDGRMGTGSFRATIVNVAPRLEVAGNQVTAEGSLLSLSDLGIIRDPGFDNPDRPGGPSFETFTYTIVWGDGSAVDQGTATIDQVGGEGVPTLASFDGQHIYADDGVYTVIVTVLDDDGGLGAGIFEVTVTNVAPTLTVPETQTVAEGALLSLENLGVISDPGFHNLARPGGATSETFTYSIDWGDGTSVVQDTATIDQLGDATRPTLASFDGSHVYADNGTYTVTVTVTDDDGGMAAETFGVVVTNVAPTLTASGDRTVAEGSLLSITDIGSITDPGFDNPGRPGGPSYETFTYTINWGDGTALDHGAAAIDQLGGEGLPTLASFDGDHVYADDGVYTVTLTVMDDDGGLAISSFEVTVTNVAPTLMVSGDRTVTEGSLVSIDDIGTLADPGFDNPDRPGGPSYETFTYTIDWGDGTALDQGTATVDQLGGEGLPTLASFDGGHVYADDGTYTVTLTAMDDDGGVASGTFVVTVANVAPTLVATGNQSIAEGALLEIANLGAISDPGFDNPDRPGGPSFETFTYTINWGDGTADELGSATIDQVGSGGIPTLASFDGSHIYADDGVYTVTVTVMDDDGGVATETFEVAVTNVAPTLSVAPNQAVDEGALLQITNLGMISDPGFDNPNRPGGPSAETFTYTINWGDGTAIVGGDAQVVQSGADFVPTLASFGGSHIYADNGTYTVTLTVMDDDGGVAIESLLVTVANVAPTLEASDSPYELNEGDVFTLDSLSGGMIHLSDPGFDNRLNTLDPSNGGETTETFTAISIDWGDGTSTTDVSISNQVSGGPGQPTTARFEHPDHAYADNGTYNVTISFSDDDGGVTHGQITIMVHNVPPTLDVTDETFTMDEGDTVTIDLVGLFEDPGFNNPLNSFAPGDGREVAETFTITIDWDSETGLEDQLQTIEMSNVTLVEGSIGNMTMGTIHSISHQYLDNDADNTYHVRVTVADDDGGVATGVFPITVYNVNPELTYLAATDVGSDGVTNLTLEFTDLGADSFLVYIDWGYGTGYAQQEPELFSPGIYSFSHTYEAPPNPENPSADINISVQVRDDDAQTPGVMAPGFSNVLDVDIGQPGTNPNPEVITFPQPMELAGSTLPEPVEQLPVVAVATPAAVQSQGPDVRSGGGDVAATSERYFILVVVNPDGSLGDRFRLPDEAMDDLTGLFARHHDDHYRIYLVRTESQSYRLVIDVVTRDGRMTAPGDASSGLRDRPPEAVEAAPPTGEGAVDDPPEQLAPGELLDRIEAPPLDPFEGDAADATSEAGSHQIAATAEPSHSMAVATAALAAAAVAIDPKQDWSVRLERAFASADPRRWRRLRRRRPR